MADLYLIDGSNLLYRSFYALPRLTTSAGQPTNALYGFAVSVFKLIGDRRPSRLAVVFDVKGPTFRHKAFAGYKAQRPPAPDDLLQQVAPVKELVALLGIPRVEQQGFEADDLIAGLALAAARTGERVFVLTSDKDLLQILSDQIHIIHPADASVRDVHWFRRTYGFAPERMPDYLALTGDASDNIPGVRGIGPKTASSLIARFGSLDNLYDHIDEVAPARVQNLLLAGREDAFASRDLATVRPSVPPECDPASLPMWNPDPPALTSFLERFELKSLIPQARRLFPIAAKEPSLEEILSIGSEEVPFPEVRAHPSAWKRRLEDRTISKTGFHLKDKAIALWRSESIVMRNLLFDVAVARYLTGSREEMPTLAATVARYREILKEQGVSDLFEKVEMPLVEVLFAMERAGIGVDRTFLENLKTQFSANLSRLADRIYQEAGTVFNINSSRQTASVLFERLGLKTSRKTRSGYSTDSSVLEELRHVHPLPGLLLEYRALFKLSSTYIDGLIQFINPVTGRIHPTFNQMVTATGRLSCSDPNLQNLPIRTEQGGLIRRAFRPSPGNIFCSFDYSQIELRILAHLSGDPGLKKAFQDDRDIHQETADRLFGTGSLFSLVPDQRDSRRIAKTINFGIIYGMSPFGLSKELGISVEEASAFITAYFQTFPGVRAYIDRVVDEARRTGYVSTLLGRRRQVPELASADRSQREFGRRVAINMPVQGLAADMIKTAMVAIHRLLERRNAQSLLVLQIHDELLFDADPAEMDWLIPSVCDAMRSAVPLDVPVKIEVQRGTTYLDLEKKCLALLDKTDGFPDNIL